MSISGARRSTEAPGFTESAAAFSKAEAVENRIRATASLQMRMKSTTPARMGHYSAGAATNTQWLTGNAGDASHRVRSPPRCPAGIEVGPPGPEGIVEGPGEPGRLQILCFEVFFLHGSRSVRRSKTLWRYEARFGKNPRAPACQQVRGPVAQPDRATVS